MAFADYFNKNVQAASLLLQGLDANSFMELLEAERVGIAFDSAAMQSSEGQWTADLLVRLIARLYPNIALVAVDQKCEASAELLSQLARTINPDIEVATNKDGVSRWLVLGDTKLSGVGKTRDRVMYIGSSGWLSKLSTRAPVRSGRSGNPFGAGVTACLASANLFRSVFSEQIPGTSLDQELVLCAFDLTTGSKGAKADELGEVALGEVHLVGGGAVGNGFLWALARLKCSGALHVVDPEVLEQSNLQRYAMTSPEEIGMAKAELAKKWLGGGKLAVRAHQLTWENYVASRNDWRLERVAVAVDSAATRINVQAALPRLVLNSWTQAGEIGLSRHTFVGEAACLACLYMPKGKTLNYDEVVLKALRLPQDEIHLREVRTRLDTGMPTERAFLERIATAGCVSIEQLAPYEGKPLQSFYVEAICGGVLMEFQSGGETNRADVPMAFQSALAGVLLAADIVADAGQLRPLLPTITQIDLLRAFPQVPSSPRRKETVVSCLCSDTDFVSRYQEKYPQAAGARNPRRRGKRERRLPVPL